MNRKHFFSHLLAGVAGAITALTVKDAKTLEGENTDNQILPESPAQSLKETIMADWKVAIEAGLVDGVWMNDREGNVWVRANGSWSKVVFD